MGSGLILLLIVGMWLAVLVPMWLKSHDSNTNLSSVERFGDAMRVLSRRHVGVGDRRALILPPRPKAILSTGPQSFSQASSQVSSQVSSRLSPQGERAARIAAALGRPRNVGARIAARLALRAAASTPAHRRRRTMLVLLGLAVSTLFGGLVGPSMLLVLHLLVDVALVLFVVHCRRQAVLRAGRRARRAAPDAQVPATARPTARPTSAAQPTSAARAGGPARAARPAPARIAGIPDRMPTRPLPLTAPLPAPAARYEDPLPGAVSTSTTHGEPWSPVPVPVPTYVTKPVAPARPKRVLDLTRPGKWSESLDAPEEGLGSFDDDGELDEILDRQRAAGDW